MSKLPARDAASLILVTPQERLAASRKALVRHMARHSDDSYQESLPPTGPDTSPHNNDRIQDRQPSPGIWHMMTAGAQTWWRHHPASLALSVAQPFLGRLAQRKPFQLLAISAGLGAAVVVFKPWRLVSLGGVALAALKSTELSGLLASLLSTPFQNESRGSESPEDSSFDTRKTHE